MADLSAFLATGEGFQVIHRAVCDPGQFCSRIIPYDGYMGVEPLPRWQTRAVMSALGKVGHDVPPTTATDKEQGRRDGRGGT